MNKITSFLICVCVGLAVTLGVTYLKLIAAQDEINRKEVQLHEMTKQVDEIWREYRGIIKRIQQTPQ
ncbi:hypothetical protein [Selenomonas sp. AB3002]|uniref:hypothetical protein n=1 Tax=Selenomonas sp. AB3002 TaxID=1392502 RepID=UPI0004968FFF